MVLVPPPRNQKQAIQAKIKQVKTARTTTTVKELLVQIVVKGVQVQVLDQNHLRGDVDLQDRDKKHLVLLVHNQRNQAVDFQVQSII